MKKLQLDDFTKYKFLSNLEYSPSGGNMCFCVSNCNTCNNDYDSNLWILNTQDNSYHQLTSGNKEKSFLWLNSETIIFQAIRDKSDAKKAEEGEGFSQFYEININGGEAKKLFKIPMKVNSIKLVDEDTFLFTSTHKVGSRDSYELSESEVPEVLKENKEEKDYEVLEEIPFWSNGGGFKSGKREKLYIFKVSTKEVIPITDDCTTVYKYTLNDDNTKVVFSGASYNGKEPVSEKLFIYDLKLNKIELIKDDQFAYGVIEFVNNNELLLFGSDMREYGVNENGKFYLLNLETGVKNILTAEFDKSLRSSVGSDCRYGGGISVKKEKNYLYFATTENESSYLNKLDIKTGNIDKISHNRGSVDCFDIKNDKIALIGMRNQELQELYIINGEEEIKVSNFNSWVNEEIYVSKPEKISVKTDEGITIDGWVLKPVEYDESKKYPAILDIHGGPKTVYGEVFYHEMQLWSNMGYFVFFCNPRGSDGRGKDFADIRGKYGTIDYDDLMKFTDKVIETYTNIDENRIGVTGGSYGGFMTNWIIGHTDRFKAAASQRSISNWVSKFCTTDIGYYFVDDQNCGTPWNNIEKLWYHSPLKYADKVKTPTLFIHSEEDYRCWLAEGLQMFTALKYHGVEARLCMFRGENHELSRSGKPKHRIRRLSEITNWFENHLK